MPKAISDTSFLEYRLSIYNIHKLLYLHFIMRVQKFGEASRPVDAESGKTAIAKMKVAGATLVV
jgi:hypothetical protein